MDTNENIEQAAKLPKSRNIFKFDGAIGRISLLITFLVLCLCAILFFIIGFIIYNNTTKKVFDMIILPYGIICLGTLFYITALSYIKRLFDILCDKRKAVFIIISLYIACTSMAFIPGFTIIGQIIASLALLTLLLIPGNS